MLCPGPLQNPPLEPTAANFCFEDLYQLSEGGEILSVTELRLVDAHVAPGDSGLGGDLLAPVRDGGVLGERILPFPTFGFDDPVDLAAICFLDGDPVGVIEPDRATGLEIVYTELCAGFTLFRGAQSSKSLHILSVIEEFSKTALEVVIGRHVVEHGPLGHKGRKIPLPTKRFGLRQLEVRLVKLDSPPLDSYLGYFPCEVFRDALLNFQSRDVREQGHSGLRPHPL